MHMDVTTVPCLYRPVYNLFICMPPILQPPPLPPHLSMPISLLACLAALRVIIPLPLYGFFCREVKTRRVKELKRVVKVN